MTPTETPLPVSAVPSAPVSVWVASMPRVALLEVSAKKRIGWAPASTYCTPGWLRTDWIWALVPRAPTTPIFLKVTTLVRPAAETALVASARDLPCTRTTVLPEREVSCLLRDGETAGRSAEALAGVGAERPRAV